MHLLLEFRIDYLFQHQRLPPNIKHQSACHTNIEAAIALAQGFNVDGAPFIIGSNGKYVSGFTNSQDLLTKLGMKKEQS